MRMVLPAIRDGQGEGVMSGTWLRTAPKFHPTKAECRRVEAFDDYFIDGWSPPQPILGPDQLVTPVGSCFATEVGKALREQGVSVFDPLGHPLLRHSHMVRVGEGISNTFSLLQHVQFACGKEELDPDLWMDSSGRKLDVDLSIQPAIREVFASTSLFIFTLGLAEVWYNKNKSQACWRAVPTDAFNRDNYEFRISTVDQNIQNLRSIILAIKEMNNSSSIVFTVSPVPLFATFRSVSCTTANAVSKSILRVSVDEIMRMNISPDVYYWPSYEIVLNGFEDPFENDGRHIKKDVISIITASFCKNFVKQI